MWSMDYVITAPYGFDLLYGVSPLASYVYDMVMVNGIQWQMILPIDNTMTMSKINASIKRFVADDGKKIINYPQYIWAGNETVLTTAHGETPIKDNNTNNTFSVYDVRPLERTMQFAAVHDADKDTGYGFSILKNDTQLFYDTTKQLPFEENTMDTFVKKQ